MIYGLFIFHVIADRKAEGKFGGRAFRQVSNPIRKDPPLFSIELNPLPLDSTKTSAICCVEVEIKKLVLYSRRSTIKVNAYNHIEQNIFIV